jgi:hypothetical protein
MRINPSKALAAFLSVGIVHTAMAQDKPICKIATEDGIVQTMNIILGEDGNLHYRLVTIGTEHTEYNYLAKTICSTFNPNPGIKINTDKICYDYDGTKITQIGDINLMATNDFGGLVELNPVPQVLINGYESHRSACLTKDGGENLKVPEPS